MWQFWLKKLAHIEMQNIGPQDSVQVLPASPDVGGRQPHHGQVDCEAASERHKVTWSRY
jgi:hypothetical protein